MIAWVRARRVSRASADDGMSLIELMVGMFITSILLAGVATVFVGTLRGVRTVNVKTASTADARIAMEALSRSMRVATQPTGETSAIVSATTNAITFYAFLNRTGANATSTLLPTKVEYDWDGTCLREAQTPGRALATATSTGSIYAWDTGRVSKCLARTPTAPVFTYYTNGSSTTAITVPVGGLALATRQTVASIEALVTISSANDPSIGGIPVIDRFTLINVQNSTGG